MTSVASDSFPQADSVEFFVELRRHSLAEGHTGGLSAYGRRLALGLSRMVDPYDLILSSPEVRARETAELMAGRVPRTDKRLGPADDLLGELSAHAHFDRFIAQSTQTEAIGQAVLDVLDALNTKAGRWLVVTHSGIIQAVAAVTGGRDLGAAPRWCEGVMLHRASMWECVRALRVDEDACLG